MSPALEEHYLEERRNADEAIDRNSRLLELARHNGYPLELQPTRCGEYQIWLVPSAFRPIAGNMALVVRC